MVKIMTKKAILIGHKIKAERGYIEVGALPLPSGSGTFSFPIKVYRNRPCLDNEPYVPNIEFNDVANTPALKSLILEQFKRGSYDPNH